jgi:uncharacterized protein YegP (UPF0339 family)
MATATKKVRVSAHTSRRPTDVSQSGPMEFLIFEDNLGGHHWTIVSSNGATLAQSGSYASHDDAEQAAGRVHDGAGAARFARSAAAERTASV